jgi:hypothetical protein
VGVGVTVLWVQFHFGNMNEFLSWMVMLAAQLHKCNTTELYP